MGGLGPPVVGYSLRLVAAGAVAPLQQLREPEGKAGIMAPAAAAVEPRILAQTQVQGVAADMPLSLPMLGDTWPFPNFLRNSLNRKWT